MAFLKLGNISESKTKNVSQGVYNALDYIFNPHKTENEKLIGGYNLNVGSEGSNHTKVCYEQMRQTKYLFGKIDGRQAYHFKLSFAEDDKVTPELVLKITNEFCDKALHDYECAYSCHTNTKHLHSHVVFNSVSIYDGRKYYYANGDWEKIYQPILNAICEKYHLSKIELFDNEEKKKKSHSYAKWLKNNPSAKKRKSFFYGNSFYTNNDIKKVIDDCIRVSYDWNDFTLNLESHNFKIDDHGKYLKVLAPGRKRWCRTYVLTEDKQTYTKDNILAMINGTYIKVVPEVLQKFIIDDLNKYIQSKKKSKEKKPHLNVAILIRKENLDFASQNDIYDIDTLNFYKVYLNAVDKQMNQMRKRIESEIESKQVDYEKIKEILRLKDSFYRYKRGDQQFKNDYDRILNIVKELQNNGYELVQLYTFMQKSEKLLSAINEYKKHIFVERKICDRLEHQFNGDEFVLKSNIKKL